MTEYLPRFRLVDQHASQPIHQIGEFRFLIQIRTGTDLWTTIAAAHTRDPAELIRDTFERSEADREQATA